MSPPDITSAADPQFVATQDGFVNGHYITKGSKFGAFEGFEAGWATPADEVTEAPPLPVNHPEVTADGDPILAEALAALNAGDATPVVRTAEVTSSSKPRAPRAAKAAEPVVEPEVTPEPDPVVEPEVTPEPEPEPDSLV